MATVPEILTKHGLEIVYGTDPDREGAFLELGRRSATTWDVVAELFSPEHSGAFTFWMEGELPADVVQAFIEYGHGRLSPPGWGAA
jgi:hypothetical protein